MKKLLLILFASFVFADVNVAISANLSVLKKALLQKFHSLYPGIKVRYFTGSSGALVAQVLRGAFYDVFLSADVKHPLFLYKKNLAFTRPVVYAKGGLVLFSKKRIELKDINSLSQIAVANPKVAPYGRAAVEMLSRLNYKNRLIFAQNVSQALFYGLNATDAAVLPKSVLFSKAVDKRNVIQIPKNLYSPIKQAVVLLKRAKDNKDAMVFFTFVLSKEAAEVFKKFGYDVGY